MPAFAPFEALEVGPPPATKALSKYFFFVEVPAAANGSARLLLCGPVPARVCTDDLCDVNT